MDSRPVNPPAVGVVHVHSNYSHDGRDSLERLREFAQERGISFVGLTDHAEDFDASRFEEYREHCAMTSDGAVQLIAGLEFRFAGFPGLHLLAFGLTRWIEPRTPAEFVRQVAGHAGFTMVAHPVLPKYRIPAEVLEGIDAIEVWNASYNTRYFPDPRAIQLLHQARRLHPHIVGIAGLDQHDSRNDRETRVILIAGQGADPLAELKAGRFTNRGRTMGFDAAVSWSPLRLRALAFTRWSFDCLERTQEGIARAFRTLRKF
jgi:hypothetical protein